MSNRPSGSSSISVRGVVPSSPARNIESVISIPPSVTAAVPRPRVVSQGRSPRSTSVHEQRYLSSSHGSHPSSFIPSSPPIRPIARPLMHAVASSRGNVSPNTTYEPRVIRADTLRNAEVACPSSSSSSSRTRRPSGSSIVRAQSIQRLSAPHATPSNPDPVPFPRPAYLEHSAFRHLLRTEIPSILPSIRMEAASRADYPSSGRRSHRSPSVDSDEEDLSPPRELRKSPPPMVPASFPTLLIPTRWCEEMRYSHLSVSPDGRELTYQGNPSAPEKDTATARTAVPVPPACGIYYFEVEIGGKAQKSRVSIGFIGREVKLSRLPGWEKNSWGYHGDTATVCSGEKNGTSFGSVFGVGDIIGCGIDFSQNKVFYTKNGALLGTVFDNVGKDGDIFPAVGLCHTLESVKANFGQEPFKYDIEDHVLQQRNQMWAKIQSHPLKWPNECKFNDGAEASVTEESVKTPLNELILTYLSHHGYVRTARAFEASCSVRGGLLASSSPKVTRPGAPSIKVEDSVMDLDLGNASPSSLPANCRSSNVLGTDDIETRTHIVQSIIAGDIDTALSETQAHFPLVLEADGGIMLFKLRCRKFVELVLEAAELKKKMQVEEDGMSTEPVLHGEARNSDAIKTIPEGMDMDVDDELPGTRNRTNGYATSSRDDIPSELARKSTPLTSVSTDFVAATAAQYGAALEKAVLYGQELESEYKHRSEVRAIFKRTSVIMAYYDPLEAGGDAAEVAGQSARVTLATELNQAILQSQGHPAQPLLDRLYRHTAVCLTNLAMTGTGAAAFADIQKEFLDA